MSVAIFPTISNKTELELSLDHTTQGKLVAIKTNYENTETFKTFFTFTYARNEALYFYFNNSDFVYHRPNLELQIKIRGRSCLMALTFLRIRGVCSKVAVQFISFVKLQSNIVPKFVVTWSTN